MRKSPINIIGGFYKDPNLHWSRQDTLNWIPVAAEQGGTLTQYQLRDAPGVKPFVRITRTVEIEGPDPDVIIDVGPVRGMRNVEGKLFVVAAQTVYQISNTGVAIPVGTIPGVGRVSMAHNQFGLSNQLIIVNGSAGYIVDTSLLTVTKITDEGYPGAFVADYIDQYLAQVEPQGRYWFHSDLAQGLHYNTLDRYEAEADPDRIVSLLVSHREVLIFGKDTIEPFVNTGGQTGTFERASNTVIEVGCSAKFTPRKLDNSVLWLDDKRLVRRLDGYTPIRISTDAIDAAFSECSEAEIAQAYAFTWETRGHKVYYITVPGRFTFGYDVLTRQWHRRSTWNLPHWDVIDAAFWNGKWIVASGRYGRLYELDQDYKLDSCDPLVRKRVTGKLWDSENELTLNNVELKFNTGGKASVCVVFPDQPEGPSITGSAPDGDTGAVYSYAYSPVAGDAPIARTVLLSGTLLPGLTWNQSTATISGTPTQGGNVSLRIRTIDTNGLFADLEDSLSFYGTVIWDEDTHIGGDYDIIEFGVGFRSITNGGGAIRANIYIEDGDWYWETNSNYLLASTGNIHQGTCGIYRNGDGAVGSLINRIDATSDGEVLSIDDVLFPSQLVYEDWILPVNETNTVIVRNRVTYTSGSATWSIALGAGDWITVMTGVDGIFTPRAFSRGTSLDGGTNAARTVRIFSRPDQFTYTVPDGALPIALLAPAA